MTSPRRQSLAVTTRTGGAGRNSLYGDRLQTQPENQIYSSNATNGSELERSRNFSRKSLFPMTRGKPSIDPTALLNAIDEQEGVTRRTSNWPYRSSKRFILEADQPDIRQPTAEEKFDRFIAERSERHSQYFAVANMVFVLYGCFIFARCSIFDGFHSYKFFRIESTECRLNRLIWMVRVTCIVQILTVITLKAYLVNNDELKRRALLRLSGGSLDEQHLRRHRDSSDHLKFMYVVVQMTVFLLATCAVIYAHCTQFIVHLDPGSTKSLYGILQYNLFYEFKNEWDAGPHPFFSTAGFKRPWEGKQDEEVCKKEQEDLQNGIPEVSSCHEFQKSASSLNHISVTHGLSGYFDLAQMELKCCGLNGPLDWKQSVWWKNKMTDSRKKRWTSPPFSSSRYSDRGPNKRQSAGDEASGTSSPTSSSHGSSDSSSDSSTPSSALMVDNQRYVPLTCCTQLDGDRRLGSAGDFYELISMPCYRDQMLKLYENFRDEFNGNCTPYPKGCYEGIKEIYDELSYELLIHTLVLVTVSFLFLILSQLFVLPQQIYRCTSLPLQ